MTETEHFTSLAQRASKEGIITGLTKEGKDAVLYVLGMIGFGSKHAGKVFEILKQNPSANDATFLGEQPLPRTENHPNISKAPSSTPTSTHQTSANTEFQYKKSA